MNSSSMADPTSMLNIKDQCLNLNNTLNGGQSNDSFESILSNTKLKQIKADIMPSENYQMEFLFIYFSE